MSSRRILEIYLFLLRIYISLADNGSFELTDLSADNAAREIQTIDLYQDLEDDSGEDLVDRFTDRFERKLERVLDKIEQKVIEKIDDVSESEEKEVVEPRPASPLEELTNKIKCLDKSPRYRARPNKTVDVEVDLSIISISALDLEKMELRVDLYMDQSWTDDRCKFRMLPRQENEITLQGHGLEDLHNLLNHLWMPDTYFVNAKETTGHDTPQPQQNTKVEFSGKVTHSSRLTVTGACPMSLWLFPFDRQHCSLILSSYSFDKKQVEYKWNPIHPINFEHSLDYQDRMMPEVLLVGYRIHEKEVVRRKKKISQLHLDLYMSRPLGHYLFDLYLPAICIVFMSWINFWLTRSAGPERVGLGMTIVLTLTTHMANANSNLPKTSYPKAIGVYLSVCFVFTFVGLVENIIASMEKKLENPNSQTRQRLEEKRNRRLMKLEEKNNRSMDGLPARQDFDSTLSNSPPSYPKISNTSNIFLTRREKVKQFLWPRFADQKSRIYFPLFFLMFNLLYWSICCTIGEPLPNDIILLRNATFLDQMIEM